MWNERIVKFVDKNDDNKPYWSICEVYYDEEGIPWGCCDIGNPQIYQDDFTEFSTVIGLFKELLEKYQHAMDAPVLDFEIDFTGEDPMPTEEEMKRTKEYSDVDELLKDIKE